MIHYDFPKGVKLLVILKNGSNIVDKYVETKHNVLILEKNRIRYENIRSTTIYKPNRKL